MRRAPFLALLLAVGGAAAHLPALPAPAACAKDDKDDKAKERDRIKRELSLKSIAGKFGAKDVSGLLERVPGTSKVTLDLGKDAGDCSSDQARGVLQQYFDGVETLSVDTTNESKDGKDGYVIKGLVGRFPLTFRRKGENKSKTVTLLVTLGPIDAADKYTLAKLQIV